MNIIYRDHMLEPLALLGHLAAVVTRVRFGTSVIILPYREPLGRQCRLRALPPSHRFAVDLL